MGELDKDVGLLALWVGLGFGILLWNVMGSHSTCMKETLLVAEAVIVT